jgi:Fic family protein
MLYKLEKPNLSKVDPKKVFENIFKQDTKKIQETHKLIQETFQPAYLYWDKVKYKSLPKNISREEFWMAVKFFRNAQTIKSEIKSESEKYFTWVKLQELEEFFHKMDMNTGGNLFTIKKNIDEKNKQKLISRGVMEEAIASSQLEGANTTRKIAKQFLREGRKPKNKSEQMILNNYQTMQTIDSEYKNRRMDLNMIFELHSMITKNTTEENEQGKFRKDKDNIVVSDKCSGIIYHQPPKVLFVKKEIERFIKFANDELDESFLHPLIKAIMLHFWIGYLHPFTDGNGRLARLMFYWYLLKKDYWAFSYLPISKAIKKSPVQYSNAYIYSEQDDLDLTYFIDYNIRKIKLAIKDFEEYFARKSKENLEMNKLSRAKYNLNERQIQLLQYFYGDKYEKTSFRIHMSIYQIAKRTAIKDLKDLEKLGFIVPEKRGRNVYYYATDRVEELFK